MVNKIEEEGIKRIQAIVSGTGFFILRVPEDTSKEDLVNALCKQTNSVIDESDLQIDEIDDQEDRASLLGWLGEFKKIMKGEM